MTIFGRRDLWAIELDPLVGAPEEADPAAASTWCALRIWAKGRNLTAHTRTDTLMASESLRWPAAYLARWFLHGWADFWERAGSPLAGPLINPELICRKLDGQLAMLGDEADDDLLDRRDAFVASHSLLAASGGGVMPGVYFLREGPHVEVIWRDSGTPGSDVRFHEANGRVRVEAGLFLDAIKGFLSAVREATAQSAPQLATNIGDWLARVNGPEAALAVLEGYVRPWGVPSSRAAAQDVEQVLELPANWWSAGPLLDAAKFPIAVVFRALSPVLDTADVLKLIARLRSSAADPLAAARLETLRKGLRPAAGDLPHEQGYRLAELVRHRLGNPDRALDVEDLLVSYGIPVKHEALSDADIEAATVWDDAHGPLVIVNEAGRSRFPWALRMTIAHELCHLLVDREDAAPLMIASTPWTPPEMERRANAFAAELLLPRAGILRVAGKRVRTGSLNDATRAALMTEFNVGETVCVRHVENRFRWDDEG